MREDLCLAHKDVLLVSLISILYSANDGGMNGYL